MPNFMTILAVDAGVAAVASRDDATIEASVEAVTPVPRPRVRPPRWEWSA